jgi:ribosomal protein S18 acetylase RimI-like enzyme
LVVKEIDCREPGVAEQVHAVRQAAYAQEAEILDVQDFPPLRVGVEELRESTNRHFGVRRAGRIVAALELEHGTGALCINSLVVAPDAQRQGFGSSLVDAAIAAAEGNHLEVQTGLRNERAVRLYVKHGFMQVRVWRLDSGLELVRLHRPGRGSATAA